MSDLIKNILSAVNNSHAVPVSQQSLWFKQAKLNELQDARFENFGKTMAGLYELIRIQEEKIKKMEQQLKEKE